MELFSNMPYRELSDNEEIIIERRLTFNVYIEVQEEPYQVTLLIFLYVSVIKSKVFSELWENRE